MKKIFTSVFLLLALTTVSFHATASYAPQKIAPVVIAVIDTGLDSASGIDVERIIKPYDFLNGSSGLSDENGHGTRIAETVATCSNCSIMPLKVLDSKGRGTNSDVANAIIYAVDNGADVINMSLGGFSYSQKMSDAVKYANDKNVIMLVSDNDANGLKIYPAGYPKVIGISNKTGAHKTTSVETANVSATVGRMLSLEPDLNAVRITEKLSNENGFKDTEIVLGKVTADMEQQRRDNGIVSAQYASDVHEYLTAEALKYLKTKNPEAYNEMSLYLDQLRQGSYDEDAIGPDINTQIDVPWRPLRHFYRITDGLGYFDGGLLSVSNLSTDFSNIKTPDVPDNTRYPNAYTWTSGTDTSNKHDYKDAIAAYKAGNKADAYYKLGFTLHLIEDMSVPEHTQLESHNDDPFPTGGLEEGSGYEQFVTDQYSSGYEDDCGKNSLRNYLHPFCTPPSTQDTFHAISVKPVFSYYDDVLSAYTSLKQYFDSMATLGYYRNRFKANLDLSTRKATGELADMFYIEHAGGNSWYIYSGIGDWGGISPVSKTDEWWETNKFDGNPDVAGWYYIENSYNKLDISGNPIPNVYNKNWAAYAETEMKKPPSERFKTQYSGAFGENTDRKILADIMAEDLVPLAVQHAAGVMDLFWRETRATAENPLPGEDNAETTISGSVSCDNLTSTTNDVVEVTSDWYHSLLVGTKYRDFGLTLIGKSKIRTINIRNLSSRQISPVMEFISPPDTILWTHNVNQFEIINHASGKVILPNECASFSVIYSPTSIGGDRLNFKISNANSNPGERSVLFLGAFDGEGIESAGDYYLYKVADSLSKIASEFMINESIIIEDNNITHPDNLESGVVLKINKALSGITDLGSTTASSITTPTTPTYKYFSDTATHWAKDYIDALYEKGIVKGRTATTFEPDATITRAELIKMTIMAMGLSTATSGTSTFADVSTSAWYSPFVEKAYAEGVIEGNMVNSKRYFRPNDAVVRAEALKILLYGAGHKVFDAAATTNLFTDVHPGDWFYGLVDYAKTNSIVSGYSDGSFKPARQVTRAEAAKILHEIFFGTL